MGLEHGRWEVRSLWASRLGTCCGGTRRGRAGLGRGWEMGTDAAELRCRRSRQRQTRVSPGYPAPLQCPSRPFPLLLTERRLGRLGAPRVSFSTLTLAPCDVAFGKPAAPAFLSQTWPVVRTPCMPRLHSLSVTGAGIFLSFQNKGPLSQLYSFSIAHG